MSTICWKSMISQVIELLEWERRNDESLNVWWMGVEDVTMGTAQGWLKHTSWVISQTAKLICFRQLYLHDASNNTLTHTGRAEEWFLKTNFFSSSLNWRTQSIFQSVNTTTRISICISTPRTHSLQLIMWWIGTDRCDTVMIGFGNISPDPQSKEKLHTISLVSINSV